MCALAGGALWCLIALYARNDLIVLSLPIAAVVAWALRAHGYAASWPGALIAVACVALASAYSLYLQATAQVAALLGLPLRDALTQIDPAMALDIARTGLDTGGRIILFVALAIAFGATLWPRRGRD